MKSFLAFLRIIIVGILWGIVFTEGIRVIMLCNWHFDIFGREHWQIFRHLWNNGWAPHDGKEWALVLLIVTFFPMIITGWWTLSLVAWEDLIWKVICLPYELYKKVFKKSTETSVLTNNRYGIVKRKSYKQIRPAGISTLRIPISDYGTTAISAPMVSPSASALAGSSYAPTTSYASSSIPATAPVKKKTDVAATIDHALFKFDDDDDDFDLDIDSFEKTDINKNKTTVANKSRKRVGFDDDDDEEEEYPKKSSASAKSFDFGEDDEDEQDEEALPVHRESRSNSRKTESKERRSSRTRNADDKGNERTEKSTRTRKRSESTDTEDMGAVRSPVYETLSQKGYDVLANIGVRDTLIDYVGVSEDEICFCLVDKEAGDWLADEEMFNGEEPLWFSENSHRISPVCKLNMVRKVIEDTMEDEGFEQNLTFYVVIQMANIINADDMFEIWNNMKINVTRINRGAPKEIKLFSKQLANVDDRLGKKSLDKLKNILKNLK